MPQDRLTPEERLLKVIDNPQAAKPGAFGRLTPQAPSLTGLWLWASARLKGRQVASHPLVTLRMVNRGLVAVGALVTLAWAIDFFSMQSQYQARLEMVERTQLVAPTQTKSVSLPSLDFSEVLNQTKQRNMLTLLPPKVDAPPPVQKEVEDLTPQANDLKLVGVIWSETPQAMIEQAKEGKTSLVGQGERIGPFRVTEILKDKVVLGLETGEQTWELR